jgi:hypothetical protein
MHNLDLTELTADTLMERLTTPLVSAPEWEALLVEIRIRLELLENIGLAAEIMTRMPAKFAVRFEMSEVEGRDKLSEELIRDVVMDLIRERCVLVEEIRQGMIGSLSVKRIA